MLNRFVVEHGHTFKADINLRDWYKEVTAPKFYFFDPGVVRALAKQIDDELGPEKGALLETLVLHEIKTYSDYFLQRFEINFGGTPSDNEVDFIVSRGKIRIGIEVKSAKKWDKSFNKGLDVLLSEGKIKYAYGVYLGDERLKSGDICVFPAHKFISFMHEGRLLTGL